MKDNRLVFLDGLRGILALVVFIHHFFYLFYPEFIFGGSARDFADSGSFSMGKLIALTPLNIFFNPAMAIHFFFLLSGYVQTRYYFQTNDLTFLKRSLLKRYLRLAIPTLAVVMLVFIFHKLSFIQKEWIPQNSLSGSWKNNLLPDNLDFLGALQHGVFGNFISSSKYYQVLWTMPIELINSYLILFATLLTHGFKNKLPVFILLFAVQLYFGNSFFALAFGFGSLMAYCENSYAKLREFFSGPVVNVVCLLTGLYFASYPYTAYQGALQHSVYHPFVFLENYALNPSYLVGVVLLFCFLLSSKKTKTFLSKKIFVFFGKISFMLYLVHLLVLCSFSAFAFHSLNARLGLEWTLVLTLLALIGVLLVLSWVLYALVDRPALEFGNWLAKKLLKGQ